MFRRFSGRICLGGLVVYRVCRGLSVRGFREFRGRVCSQSQK